MPKILAQSKEILNYIWFSCQLIWASEKHVIAMQAHMNTNSSTFGNSWNNQCKKKIAMNWYMLFHALVWYDWSNFKRYRLVSWKPIDQCWVNTQLPTTTINNNLSYQIKPFNICMPYDTVAWGVILKCNEVQFEDIYSLCDSTGIFECKYGLIQK